MVTFYIVAAFASKGTQSCIPVLASDPFALTEPTRNALLTVFSAFGSVGVLVGGVLADRYLPDRVIAGTLLAGLSLLLLIGGGVLPTDIRELGASFGLAGFFISLIAPSRDRLVNEFSSSGSMDQSYSIVFTGATVGNLSSPVILGAIADFASITAMFVAIGILYVFAGLLAFSLDSGLLGRDRTDARSPDD